MRSCFDNHVVGAQCSRTFTAQDGERVVAAEAKPNAYTD
jgi:hypothetical protein